MEILFKHTWVLFIVATVANGLMFKSRSKQYIFDNPELKEGYDKFVKGWMIYCNIPWLIMMVGAITGITQGTFEYFNPKAMNPMVLLFHFSVIVLWALGVWWVYFRNGAEFFETHPGLMRVSSFSGMRDLTAKQVKIVFPLAILGGILGMVFMWVADIPTPEF